MGPPFPKIPETEDDWLEEEMGAAVMVLTEVTTGVELTLRVVVVVVDPPLEIEVEPLARELDTVC